MLWNVDIFNEMERLRSEMNNLFTNYGRTSGATTYPLINAYEDEDTITVAAELPGVTKDKVHITFSDGVLTLKGENEAPAKYQEMVTVRKERSEGEFEKTVRIPTKINPDGINAQYNNGVLTITLPKAEEAKPKSIAIEA